MFDGHAGTGAALMAMSTLHIHIEDNLGGVKDLLTCSNNDELQKAPRLSEAVVSSITIESLVTGALEEAFFEMVINIVYDMNDTMYCRKGRYLLIILVGQNPIQVRYYTTHSNHSKNQNVLDADLKKKCISLVLFKTEL